MAQTKLKYSQIDGAVVNALDFGIAADGVTDDYTLLQAGITANAGRKIILPAGDYLISDTLRVPANTWLCGEGSGSVGTNIIADNITGLALTTYDGSSSSVFNSGNISDLNVSGTATAGIGFVHNVLGVYGNLTLQGFTGTDGFVWENTYGCVYTFLSTAGATISGTCFKFNRVVLDTVVYLPYSSNVAADYNFVLDKSVTEYSNTTNNAHRNVHLITPTAQGARVTGLYLRQTANALIDNLYTENVVNPVRLGDDSVAGIAPTDTTFSGGNFNGVATDGSSEVQVWLDQCSGVTFNGGAFDNATDILLGDIDGVHMNNPRLTGNADLTTVLKRTLSAPPSLPFNAIQTLPTGVQHLVKTNNNNYRLGVMTVDGLGAWSSTDVFNIPLDTGQHDGSNNDSFLTDTSKSWTVNEWVGKTLTNTTDGSSATITANTATTITGALSGGAENDWDLNDEYVIS